MPPSTAQALAYEFTHGARSKGDDYVRMNRARVVSGSADALEAVVIGTSAYRVAITCVADSGAVAVEASCDCPYFDEHSSPCKHL